MENVAYILVKENLHEWKTFPNFPRVKDLLKDITRLEVVVKTRATFLPPVPWKTPACESKEQHETTENATMKLL